MTEIVQTQEKASVAGEQTAHPDVIDVLAGIKQGDWLDQLRRLRPQTRKQAQRSHEALFEPTAPVAGEVSAAERHAVAAFVALLHQQPDVADFHLHILEALSPNWVNAVLNAAEVGKVQGPYGSFPKGPLTVENRLGLELQLNDTLRAVLGVRLHAALLHAHFLVFHPRDAQPERLHALQVAGWQPDDIVVLSQLIAFLTFQIRVVVGLHALSAHWASTVAPTVRTGKRHPLRYMPETVEMSSTPNVFTQAELDWQPWLEPLEESALTARHYDGLVDRSRAKSPYFRLLARDPDTLGARTRTDKDIFYNPDGGLPRAERELAAVAASRYNGCIYCASVHARFASHFSHRSNDVQRLLDEGVQADLDPRWNAIVDASVALTNTPSRLNASHISALRTNGFGIHAAADLLHAAAFFNWANRLMLSLGEARH